MKALVAIIYCTLQTHKKTLTMSHEGNESGTQMGELSDVQLKNKLLFYKLYLK